MQAVLSEVESSRFITYVNGQVAVFLQYRTPDRQMVLLDVDIDTDYLRLQRLSRLIRQTLTEPGRRRLSVLPFRHEAGSQTLSHPVFFRLAPSEHRQLLHESTRARRHTCREESMHKNRQFAPMRPKEVEAA